jgi:hypothetical protein
MIYIFIFIIAIVLFELCLSGATSNERKRLGY